jgi:hypothetical protein
MKHHPFEFTANPTPQEIFDRGVEFFNDPESERCANDAVPIGGGCLYTNPTKGTHCVAGYMLPEETLKIYGQEVEAISEIAHQNPIMTPSWVFANEALLSELQTIHDNTSAWANRNRMRQDLADVASSFGLKYKEPTP